MFRSKKGEWITNLQRMLGRLEIVKKTPSIEKGIHLHLGCGKEILDGFINIDKYFKHNQVLQCDMMHLPFTENSVDTIYSSHSLEHLPIRPANATLCHWQKVLRKGGMLYIAVPDLEEVCSIMADPNVSEEAKWDWYVYVLFGYQIDVDSKADSCDASLPIDQGQFHTTGFTKNRLNTLLSKTGFEIIQMFNYDGWSTPSIWCEAKKL